MKVHEITFGPFAENTVIIYDESGECIIVDPGCHSASEEKQLKQFIAENELTPVRLINTHGHLDHVYGNGFVSEEYNLSAEMNALDLPIFEMAEISARMYGLPIPAPAPKPEKNLEEGDTISFGNSSLEVIFVPGHTPGHVALVSKAFNFVINGDVLFNQGIGRTDLPGGDMATLANTILNKMYQLPENMKVYCGHGPTTTIGTEKRSNPFNTHLQSFVKETI